MDIKKVEKLYKLKDEIGISKKEIDLLRDQLKKEMLKTGSFTLQCGDYELNLIKRDCGNYSNDLVSYLRENSFSELIIETYDKEKLKDYIYKGIIKKEDILKYWIAKLIYCLYVNKNR